MHVFQTADIGGRVVADADLQGRAIDVVGIVQFITARADTDPLVGIDQGQVFEGGVVAALLRQAIGIGKDLLSRLLRIPDRKVLDTGTVVHGNEGPSFGLASPGVGHQDRALDRRFSFLGAVHSPRKVTETGTWSVPLMT